MGSTSPKGTFNFGVVRPIKKYWETLLRYTHKTAEPIEMPFRG